MERKFCDLHIYSDLSIGSASVKDMIAMAVSLDLSSICIIDYIKDKNKDNLDRLRKEIAKEKPKIEVLAGIEISTEDPEILKRQISRLRDRADIIIVSGGSSKINRVAVEDARVDILSAPEMGRRDSGLDDVMTRFAAKNSVAIELNFRAVLNTYRKVRSHILSHMRTNAELAAKYGAPLVIASGAEKPFDMRTGRELASLGNLAGLGLAESLDSVSSVPESLAKHVKTVKGKGYIMPGVEVVSRKK